jgi:hypothetical protein
VSVVTLIVTCFDTSATSLFLSLLTLYRYDFAQVSRWFAERSDLILLLFDSYKLDISDEFRGVIENLKNHDDKVPIHEELMI